MNKIQTHTCVIFFSSFKIQAKDETTKQLLAAVWHKNELHTILSTKQQLFRAVLEKVILGII